MTKYCDAIRAAGGEPMFYEMGWGKDDKHVEGRTRILDLAVKNKIKLFAPCSTAWARVYAEKPDIALQHPNDNSHPGDAGHFLNLACFYAALTGESPVGKLPRSFHVWPHGKYDADEAKLAAFKPDAYQAAMAKWMPSRLRGPALMTTPWPPKATSNVSLTGRRCSARTAASR